MSGKIIMDKAKTQTPEEQYREIWLLYGDVREEWEKWDGVDRDKQMYFQGKKDGLRTALGIIAPDAATKHHWELTNESAHAGYGTMRQVLQGQVNRAFNIISNALTGPFPETKREMKEFIEWCKRTKSVTKD